jgi:DNA processing protein
MNDARELLSEDGMAMVMLCSQLGLGDERDATALSLKEWNALAQKIGASDLKRPSALLDMAAQEMAKELGVILSDAERIVQLLARGGTIALELENLANTGIWCVARVDDAYPARIRKTLKHRAPPVLFGAGALTILQRPAVAAVGSRNLDEPGEDFAKQLGALCARASLTVVSGGARGTDRISMQAGLDSGGRAAGVLADSLSKSIRQPDVRELVADGRLVLLTPYRPDNGFSVGAAMGRNKIIYGAADYAVIVSSDYQKGGTWAGAIEALKADWCPVFIRSGANVAAGNKELVNKGALPISDVELAGTEDIVEWMKARAGLRMKQPELLPA